MAELVKQLLDKGKIKFSSEFNKTVTYHDPCHLGRHAEVYDIPRDVYKSIPGLKFVEMRRIKENAWCCGAGGGVKIGYPDWALEISKERLEEAKETDAEVLSSTCPFCKTNLNDANDKYNAGFVILDLIEILDKLEISTD
jgi:heterodisulfide reductase subunit D